MPICRRVITNKLNQTQRLNRYFRIQEIVLNKLPNVASDPEIYSMEDLVSIRDGEMKKNLRYLVELCCKHTAECQVIIAKYESISSKIYCFIVVFGAWIHLRNMQGGENNFSLATEERHQMYEMRFLFSLGLLEATA